MIQLTISQHVVAAFHLNGKYTKKIIEIEYYFFFKLITSIFRVFFKYYVFHAVVVRNPAAIFEGNYSLDYKKKRLPTLLLQPPVKNRYSSLFPTIWNFWCYECLFSPKNYEIKYLYPSPSENLQEEDTTVRLF